MFNAVYKDREKKGAQSRVYALTKVMVGQAGGPLENRHGEVISQYRCPTCNTEVWQAPMVNYDLRDLVDTISQLLEDEPKEERAILPEDPWSKYFLLKRDDEITRHPREGVVRGSVHRGARQRDVGVAQPPVQGHARPLIEGGARNPIVVD